MTVLTTFEDLEKFIRDTVYQAANDSAGYGDPGAIAAVLLKDRAPIVFGFRDQMAEGVAPTARMVAREHCADGVIFSRVVSTTARKEVIITLEHREHGSREWRALVRGGRLTELRGPFHVKPCDAIRMLPGSYSN